MQTIFKTFDEKRRKIHALIKFGEGMYTYSARLDTFTNVNWPFIAPSKCVPENLAAAGFFYYPNGGSADSVYDFVIFKEIDGWEESDDPWQEQLKRKKNHPLLSRRWAPKMDDFSCLRLSNEELTVHQVIKMGAACEEGSFQYRIDQLEALYEDTLAALVSNNNAEQAGSTNFSMNETFDDQFEACLKRWQTPVQDLIRKYRTALTKMKKTNAKRFKANGISWTNYPDADEWSAALNQPFIHAKRNIEDAKAEKENISLGVGRGRISVLAKPQKTVAQPPSSKKHGRSARPNRSRQRNDRSTDSIF